MPDFPLATKLINVGSIHTGSPGAVGREMSANSGSFGVSTAWPTANLAIYIPVEIFNPVTIAKMSVNNGTAVSGNIDVGIYDAGGKRLVSKGSTAQAGTSAIQTFDITDTLLNPGLCYMAVALDNNTGTLAAWTGVIGLDMECCGLMQQASAFALPDPAVFAVFAQTFVPLISMTPKTTI